VRALPIAGPFPALQRLTWTTVYVVAGVGGVLNRALTA
jgi:hypothetical protein